MPEGPECRVIADQLRTSLLNRYICSVGFDQRSRYARSGLTNHQAVHGMVTSVQTKGKKIVIALSTDVYLVSSLGLEGRWSLQPMDHSNLWLNVGYLTTTKPKLKVIEYQLWYDDSRHFGEFEIHIGSNTIADRLQRIGPDLLDDALGGNRTITPEVWRQVARRYPKKQICAFLMDQQHFAGIGNYLKAEILYFARIRPNKTIAEITDQELETIRQQSLRIIVASYLRQGHTSRTYRGLDGVSGTFQVVIYNKSHDPLGNPIVKQEFGDKRTTHWVPNVQQ